MFAACATNHIPNVCKDKLPNNKLIVYSSLNPESAFVALLIYIIESKQPNTHVTLLAVDRTNKSSTVEQIDIYQHGVIYLVELDYSFLNEQTQLKLCGRQFISAFEKHDYGLVVVNSTQMARNLVRKYDQPTKVSIFTKLSKWISNFKFGGSKTTDYYSSIAAKIEYPGVQNFKYRSRNSQQTFNDVKLDDEKKASVKLLPNFFFYHDVEDEESVYGALMQQIYHSKECGIFGIEYIDRLAGEVMSTTTAQLVNQQIASMCGIRESLYQTMVSAVTYVGNPEIESGHGAISTDNKKGLFPETHALAIDRLSRDRNCYFGFIRYLMTAMLNKQYSDVFLFDPLHVNNNIHRNLKQEIYHNVSNAVFGNRMRILDFHFVMASKKNIPLMYTLAAHAVRQNVGLYFDTANTRIYCVDCEVYQQQFFIESLKGFEHWFEGSMLFIKSYLNHNYTF